MMAVENITGVCRVHYCRPAAQPGHGSVRVRLTKRGHRIVKNVIRSDRHGLVWSTDRVEFRPGSVGYAAVCSEFEQLLKAGAAHG
jgi:hypothetical protein